MIKTLVTSPRVTPDSDVLMQAAEAVGQPTQRLPTFRASESLRDVPIAVYGESLFAIIVTAKLGYVVIEPTSEWLVQLPLEYTRRLIFKTTLSEAWTLQHPHFVKNADAMKAFEARVYQNGADLPSREFYPDDYPVLVAEPVEWELEYRCFIRERMLTTLSIYLRHGELAKAADGTWPDTSEERSLAAQFCQTLLDDPGVALPPACVVDVGRIAKRGWAVVEANPAYGSGIYGCDPVRVLDVVNRATLHRSDITDQDAPWVTHYEVED